MQFFNTRDVTRFRSPGIGFLREVRKRAPGELLASNNSLDAFELGAMNSCLASWWQQILQEIPPLVELWSDNTPCYWRQKWLKWCDWPLSEHHVPIPDSVSDLYDPVGMHWVVCIGSCAHVHFDSPWGWVPLVCQCSWRGPHLWESCGMSLHCLRALLCYLWR